MSDESEISLASSSQSSSGSEDTVDLSDSDSEGSETSLIPAPFLLFSLSFVSYYFLLVLYPIIFT